MTTWTHKRILITVRTYPVPSAQDIEVSCTAGITEDGQWVRLFPVPWRLLTQDARFRKWQWIEVDVRKAHDRRPESYTPNIDSIHVLPGQVSVAQNWQARRQIMEPLKAPSLCEIQRIRDLQSAPTLGFFRPKQITGLFIEREPHPEWTEAELAKLRQIPLMGSLPSKELEKVPFSFSYRFVCEESRCTGHEMMCSDWEMGEAYRRYRRKYSREWEQYFRDRFETEMALRNDTHFFVGTLNQYPNTWIIVGLFYPRQLPETATNPPLCSRSAR